jgi:hypothetical protein
MYRLIILPFISQYLTNAEHLISSYYVEIHIYDPPIISSVQGLNLERRTFNNILYEIDSSDIP